MQASLLSRSSTQSHSGRGGIEYSMTGACGNANYSDSGDHDDEDEIRDLTVAESGMNNRENSAFNSLSRKQVLHL